MRLVAAGAGLAAIALAAAVPATGGAQAEPEPCPYGSKRPAPLKIGKLPTRVVAGRKTAVRVVAQGYRGRLFSRRLTSLRIRFEQISDGAETFSAGLLRAYKKAKPGDNIGYNVVLRDGSPGERAIVQWTDAAGKDPCTGSARTNDMRLATGRAGRPVITTRSGVTDASRGDSSLLRIGGRSRGCPLTDPGKLTVVAKSASRTRRLRLDMACGTWSGAGSARVDRFTLLAEDGGYLGAARLYVSPRANPTPGAQLSLAIYKGRKRLATKQFRAVAGPSGSPKVVAGA